jgi:hypothetical protein
MTLLAHAPDSHSTKKKGGLGSPPGPQDAVTSSEVAYRAVMNRLLTSVVRPLDLLERMK